MHFHCYSLSLLGTQIKDLSPTLQMLLTKIKLQCTWQYLYVCDTFYVECDLRSVVILLVSDWRYLFCFLISKFTRFAPDVTPGSSGSAQESWASSRSSQCEVSYTVHSYSVWHMICSTSSVPLYNIIRFIIHGITTTEVTELLISFFYFLNQYMSCLWMRYSCMYMYLSDSWKILISSEGHNSETKIAEFQVLKKDKYYLEESRKL